MSDYQMSKEVAIFLKSVHRLQHKSISRSNTYYIYNHLGVPRIISISQTTSNQSPSVSVLSIKICQFSVRHFKTVSGLKERAEEIG